MTLDGRPVRDNPFYSDDDYTKAANYVWAYGLRNPFGLKMVEGRLFVADNGQSIDRFLEVKRGENYLWNGDDRSIAANSDFVFVPSVSPVQMDFLPESRSTFPAKYTQVFFLAVAAFNKKKGKIPGIMMVKYDLAKNKITDVPRYLVKYRGSKFQMVTSLAFGPDGPYYVPLYANEQRESFILEVTHGERTDYPVRLLQNEDPLALMIEKGCVGCHRIGDEWGFGAGKDRRSNRVS